MDSNRRLEIKKAIAKRQTNKIDNITKEELVKYIEETQNMISVFAQHLISNI
jgi:hypothetical protein